jgi:hypothetical protein
VITTVESSSPWIRSKTSTPSAYGGCDMVVYYFDETKSKIEELSCVKIVVGVDHATCSDSENNFKLIPISKILYIVEEN